MKSAYLLPVIVGLLGCGPEHDPVEACTEFVEIAAESASKCGGGTLDEARAAFSKALGGCSTIVAVRDEEQLYADCFPQLKGMTCEEWAAPDASLPSPCIAQFQK